MLLFQNRPWYHDQVRQKYPDLANGVAAEEAAFLDKLRQFEAGELAEGDSEIGPRYQALLRRLLDVALASRPVYATPDALGQLEQFGINLGNQVLPGAVLMRVLPAAPTTTTQLAPQPWNIQPFIDAAANGTYLDEPARKIRRSHAGMAANRGTYYARSDRWADAIPGYAQAVAIDPGYVTGYLLLAEAQQRTGDVAGARQSLESALAVDPGNVQAQERLTALGAP
jgi:tetratricopeptide (TPR) repeat protein